MPLRPRKLATDGARSDLRRAFHGHDEGPDGTRIPPTGKPSRSISMPSRTGTLEIRDLQRAVGCLPIRQLALPSVRSRKAKCVPGPMEVSDAPAAGAG